MNKITVVLGCAVLAAVVHGEEIAADYHEGETSAVLLTPDMQAAADAMLGAQADAMLHALKLQMAKYDRDMRTPTGRKEWHGKLVKEEIYTNELVKVEVYSNELDGAVWRYKLPFKVPRPRARALAATTPVMTTNGVPARLAAARAKRAAELAAGTQTVTVTVSADGRSQ